MCSVINTQVDDNNSQAFQRSKQCLRSDDQVTIQCLRSDNQGINQCLNSHNQLYEKICVTYKHNKLQNTGIDQQRRRNTSVYDIT